MKIQKHTDYPSKSPDPPKVILLAESPDPPTPDPQKVILLSKSPVVVVAVVVSDVVIVVDEDDVVVIDTGVSKVTVDVGQPPS